MLGGPVTNPEAVFVFFDRMPGDVSAHAAELCVLFLGVRPGFQSQFFACVAAALNRSGALPGAALTSAVPLPPLYPQEERLKKEWRKRGWNIAILEEQFQQRQLEFIRAKHQDRQKALEAAARRGSTPTPGPSGHPGPSSSGLPGPLPPYLENRSALGPVKAPEPEEEGQDEEAPPEAAGYGPDAYIYDRYGQLVHAPEGGPEPVPPAGAGAPAGAAPAPPPFEFLEDDVPWEPDSFKDPPPPLIPDGEEGDEDDEVLRTRRARQGRAGEGGEGRGRAGKPRGGQGWIQGPWQHTGSPPLTGRLLGVKT